VRDCTNIHAVREIPRRLHLARRADELEELLEAAERRLKERAEMLDPLRASENQYIREERLRDEIVEVRAFS